MITDPPDMRAWWDALPDDLPDDQLTLVVGVIEALDSIDHYAETVPTIAANWAPGAAAIVRIALHVHRPDEGGSCTECTGAQVWPCVHWRTAYHWLIDYDPRTGTAHDSARYQVVSPR